MNHAPQDRDTLFRLQTPSTLYNMCGTAVHCIMHAVLLTPTFETQLKAAGVSEVELSAIVSAIAQNPLAGDLIVGTGGARKLRFPSKGKGKSGGYRTVHYYAGEDVPVFLLALISKGQRADLSQAERNELRDILATLADAYRTGVERTVKSLRRP